MLRTIALFCSNPIARIALRLLGGIVVALSLAQAANFEQIERIFNKQYGAEALQRFRDWRQVQHRVDSRTAEIERLAKINQFVNRRIVFSEDIVVWGRQDYWATPFETLGKGAGDCEDLAILKYFSLIEAGVDRARLRLIYVRAMIGLPGQGVPVAHMVLGFYETPSAEPLILDNLITEILPAGRRPDLTPVFSFNGEGVWTGGGSGRSSPIDRLARWTELIQRMKYEGYAP